MTSRHSQSLEERAAEMRARQKQSRRERAMARIGSVKCARVGCKRRVGAGNDGLATSARQKYCRVCARAQHIKKVHEAQARWYLKNRERLSELRQAKRLFAFRVFAGQVLRKPPQSVTDQELQLVAQRFGK